MASEFILSFDLGGSHLAGALFAGTSPVPLAQGTRSLGSECAPAEFFETAARLGEELQRRAGAWGLTGVAMAVPGPFDPERGICRFEHKLRGLYGADFRDGLSHALHLSATEFSFTNDADAFLLGEIECDSKRRTGRLVGITLGTGVGSAFAIDGLVVSAGTGVPEDGEIWNVSWRNGTVEDFVSAHAIRSNYMESCGGSLNVHEIALAASGDACARRVFAEFGKTLGEMLNEVCGGFRPEVVVLGGSIARSAELFVEQARESAGPHLRIEVSTLFEQAALRGAVRGWKLLRRSQAQGRGAR